MKTKFHYFIIVLLVVFTGCDYNEVNFDELDQITKPKNVKEVEYTLTEADYTAIANNAVNKSLAESKGISNQLSSLKSSFSFSESLSAADFIPAFLNEKWPSADKGYASKITFNYKEKQPEYLTNIANAQIYALTNEDYALAWGDEPNSYFNAVKPVYDYANSILTKAFPSSNNGDLKVITYNYTSLGEIKTTTSVYEDFETVTSGQPVSLQGWSFVQESGDVKWIGKSYSGNFYAQCSAYNAPGEVVTWMISPAVTLTNVESPKLTFDIALGYYNADCLQVLISDDYNGTDPSSATWTDVTDGFAFYHKTSGYTSMYNPGIYELDVFKAKPIYVAFKYVGNGSAGATTTVQIDNVQIGNEIDVAENIVFVEDFEAGATTWTNVAVQGTATWQSKTYSNNKYMQCSAFGTTGEQEVWFVSPEIIVPSEGAPQLGFDAKIGYYNASCLSVMISSDYVDDINAATWTDISNLLNIPTEPTSGYGSFVQVNAYSLQSYAGSNIRLAYKYVGNAQDSRSTTYQIDNIKVSGYSHIALKSGKIKSESLYTKKYVPYKYDGNKWNIYEGVAMPNSDDYDLMGFSYFNSSINVDNYLKTFLEESYPYAQDEDVMAVAYLYNSDKSLASVEYAFTAGEWVNTNMAAVKTEQFVKSSNGFVWDPSVVINLLPVKNDPIAMLYYQTATDWVWENIDQNILGVSKKGDGYVTSYGNNEYYTGCSAYYNNVDMRVGKVKEQYAAGYEDLTDEEIVALMEEHLQVVMGEVLSIIYPDAMPIDGVDITYTINLGIYTGTSITDPTHSLVYKLANQGEFEYLSGPTLIE